jgi:hypothetical protein
MCTVHAALGTEHHQELTTNGPRVGQGTLARKDLARTRGRAGRQTTRATSIRAMHARIPTPRARPTRCVLSDPVATSSNCRPGGPLARACHRMCVHICGAGVRAGEPAAFYLHAPTRGVRPRLRSCHGARQKRQDPCAPDLAPAGRDTAAPGRSRSPASLDHPIT